MIIVPERILIIQTAFIGDVILATALLEKIHQQWPEAKIDFLIRKGNESLVDNHPYINELLIWDKKTSKYKSLWALIKRVRNTEYDLLVNTQRFGATGLLTALSGAAIKSGFSKNPFSFSFTHAYLHEIGNGTHEVKRNHSLIASFTDAIEARPKLYPSTQDFKKIDHLSLDNFLTISPSSVWFTKQFPADKWIQFIQRIPASTSIYLLGGPGDKAANEKIIEKSQRGNIENLAGQLSLLQSAALMSRAQMNYVNDSGPLHLASAMNAPVTAVFCSTIPEFGFTPLSEKNNLIETKLPLDCRPCGLHGHKSCPKGHFNCANTIEVDQLLKPLTSVN